MRERIDAIDFWRGVALATIFINHIPGNVLGNFTPRNYGFSDSAEAFIFLSGMSVALAYSRLCKAEASLAAVFLMRRAARLYGVHLALTLAALALYGATTILNGHDGLLGEHGRGTPFSDPIRGALGIVTLGHQIGYFNILPIYIVFLFLAPTLLVFGLHSRWKMLAFSFALYAATRGLGLNLPSWPEPGVWYFNPMAWQLMFALGIFAGLAAKEGRIPFYSGVYHLAHLFTIGAAIIVSNCLGLAPGLVDAAGQYLDWDKTQLGAIRIIDFLALAYVIFCSSVTAKLQGGSLYRAASLLGRHALPIYCGGSLLSAVGHILHETWTASPLFDVVFVVACLNALHKVAAILERRRETGHHRRVSSMRDVSRVEGRVKADSWAVVEAVIGARAARDETPKGEPVHSCSRARAENEVSRHNACRN